MPAPQAPLISIVRPHSQFLEGLSQRDRDHVLDAATHRRFPASAVITRQGTPADHLYLLVKGRARFFFTTPEGQKILLIWMPPGDIFGALALRAKKGSYMVSVEAIRDSEVLVWDRATIRRLGENFPVIFDNALTIAAEYIEWAMSAHVALSCHTARERLGRILMNLSTAIGEVGPDGIEIDVTNEELANAANITPYTASRLMSGWQKSRAIAKRRGKVVLRNPELVLRTQI